MEDRKKNAEKGETKQTKRISTNEEIQSVEKKKKTLKYANSLIIYR